MLYWYTGSLVILLFIHHAMASSAHNIPLNNTCGSIIAVQSLLQRIIPYHHDLIDLEYIPKTTLDQPDYFQFYTIPCSPEKRKIIQKNQVCLKVESNSINSLAAGAGWYLKYHMKLHFSWSGINSLNAADVFPEIKMPVKMERAAPLSYYQNVCTLSYSFVWWGWKRWEQELDWMALSGINFPLAFIGQEYVWMKVFEEFGVDKSATLSSFFSGPAFLAWQRMGNLQAWGNSGSLSEEWIVNQFHLQLKILDRMYSLGMDPILPAFSGHVPRELIDLYPNTSYTESPSWNGFREPYCCVRLLDSNSPLYRQIGKRFIELQAELYRLPISCVSARFYNADTFNENDPASADSKFLADSSSAVYEAMAQGDSNAVWVMQGWLFFNSPFWDNKTIPAYLSGVSKDKMIILDLYADVASIWKKTNFFYGKPFIWCMLHNFGGNIGLYGRLPFISTNPLEALNAPHSTMIGTGMTPEGINQNFIVYDLMTEMSWRKTAPNVSLWVQEYITRRYSLTENGDNYRISSAWLTLSSKVYDCNIPESMGIPKSLIVLRPSLADRMRTFFMPTVPCHSSDDIIAVLKDLFRIPESLSHQDQFRYDLVDITRQLLSDLFINARESFSELYYSQGDISSLQNAGKELLSLVSSMEAILATHDRFLLGNWIRDAKRSAPTSDLESIFEYNARNQLTLWGPNGEISDYASKQWSGLVGTYYLPRWELFVQEVIKAAKTGYNFNQQSFNKLVLETVEKPWQWDSREFPTTAKGDSFTECYKVFEKFVMNKQIE